ncbi:hypothetical protein INT45_000496 [Circinella minor]|uniref:Uncharacterized protein n=1 Tax=Circinella minor TaxID=1195481 RepID=A0A8H7S554_9FUNG|nr:hypothetical protein INT45_000496 [Circinella minor]
MTVPRANDQSQPTSQAPHQHPGASFAQLMSQSIADSDDEADELPLDFVRQPCNSRGKVRNPTKSDVEGAVLALVNGNVEEQQKKLAGIEKHVDTAIERMKMLVPSNMVSDSWTSQDKSICNTFMKLFLDSVSKSHPFVPLDECEKNWIARHFLVQKWNNIHMCNEGEERDEVTGSTGGAMSLCSSLQSREIVHQFSVLGTSASRSRPAAIPPALTWEVSISDFSFILGIPSALVTMPVPTAAPPTVIPAQFINHHHHGKWQEENFGHGQQQQQQQQKTKNWLNLKPVQ